MALPRGWRRLTPAQKASVRRLYNQSVLGGTSSRAARELYDMLRGMDRAEILDVMAQAGDAYATTRVAQLASAAERTALGARAALWSAHGVAGSRRSLRVSPIDAQRSSRLFAGGEVWLSRNLHRANSRGVIDGLRHALQEGARHGRSATEVAQQLRDQVGHRVDVSKMIPKALRDIEREAYAAIRSSGDPRAAQTFAPIRRQFREYAEGLRSTDRSTQAAAMDALRKIESAVARADAAGVESAVKWWTWNREQEHQRLIARTELSRSFSHAYVDAARDVPSVVGFEWNADGDACEDCAALDGKVMGWGEIIYPPLHPHCGCLLIEVLDPSKEPTEEEWDRILAS